MSAPEPASCSRVAPAHAASRPIPRRFGRYGLFDFIGKGGMAEIYLARARTELGGFRLCVVKQIGPEFAEDAKFADMLTHEAKLAARLSHANIVQVFDLGRADGQLYIAMEYVEGFDLNALLRQCSKAKLALPVEFGLHIVIEALKGLDYAHRRMDESGRPLGIVHRDVSPSNVLVSFEGEVKLCDFGIAHANQVAVEVLSSQDVAHAAASAASRPAEDALKGKAGYMSPEHARGDAIDARSDVFAVGIVLWELLSGRRMYVKDAGGLSLLEQARRAEAPPVAPRGLPREAELHGIVSRALASDRDARYPSAGAMLKDLEDFVRAAKLTASPLRFGDWLIESFGTDIVTQRRARERAADALEHAPDPNATPLPIPPPQEQQPLAPAPALEAVADSEPGSARPSSSRSSRPPRSPRALVDAPPSSASPMTADTVPRPRATPPLATLMLIAVLLALAVVYAFTQR